jgi:3-deoxy-D-manno-octulosonate 8-phosphate phosphatase (KDO 8-P phosphatase)
MQFLLKNIKLLILDVDGVLTDGKLYYTMDGETQKVFHVKDGLGIKLALKHIEVAIISGNPSAIIERRAKDLGIKHCYTGISDKGSCIQNLSKELAINFSEIAFIGDDLNDLVAKEFVGLLIAPADAHKMVLEHADIVLQSKGGKGAVREFIDTLLHEHGVYTGYEKGIKEKNI